MEIQTDFDDRDLTWLLRVHRDYDDARLCLEGLRRVYPTSRIIMISDGDDDARWPQLAQEFDIEYSKGARFFGLESGGQLWKRFFVETLKTPSTHIFHLDSDARVHRRFRFLPTGNLVFGTLEHRTEVFHAPLRPPNVQGGFTGFTLQAAQQILNSGVLDEPEWRSCEAVYGDIPDAMWIFRKGVQCVITDFQLRYIYKRLNLPIADFSEVRSQFLSAPEIADFAITHPHKARPRTFSRRQTFAIKMLRFRLKIKRWLRK